MNTSSYIFIKFSVTLFCFTTARFKYFVIFHLLINFLTNVSFLLLFSFMTSHIYLAMMLEINVLCVTWVHIMRIWVFIVSITYYMFSIVMYSTLFNFILALRLLSAGLDGNTKCFSRWRSILS